MALTFSCPSCRSVLRVSDEMAGKKARCPSCQTVFTLPMESEAAAPLPPPAPKPPAPAESPVPKKAAPPIALTPDEDDEAPRSRKPSPLSEKPKRRSDEEEEDDDRPKRKRPRDEDDDEDSPRPPRRRPIVDNDDDEEEDEDRPRRRRRKKTARSNTGMWVLGGIGALVVLLVCAGGITFIYHMGGGGQKIALVNGAATLNDSLGITDSFDTQRRNCRCRRYQIDMVKGRTYTIDQISAQIDTFLRLENPTGAQVAADDDGGAIIGGGVMNLNARINYVAPQTGTYTIIATSFDARLGPYTLSVREMGGGQPPFKK